MTAKRVRRGGTYYRVCGPDWADPADTSYAKQAGGRWNPAGEFGALYLSHTLEGARANARRFITTQFGNVALLEDLNPDHLPDAQAFDVTYTMFVDAVTPAGRRALALPERDNAGVNQAACQAIARRLYAAKERGIASLAALEGDALEDLAVFDAFASIAKPTTRTDFAHWYPPRA